MPDQGSATQRNEGQQTYSVGEKSMNVVRDGDEVFVAARESPDHEPQVILLRDHDARELYEQLGEVFDDE